MICVKTVEDEYFFAIFASRFFFCGGWPCYVFLFFLKVDRESRRSDMI
jgi:hypothetical protein